MSVTYNQVTRAFDELLAHGLQKNKDGTLVLPDFWIEAIATFKVHPTLIVMLTNRINGVPDGSQLR